MTTGSELREARVRLGRSREEISRATKIQVGKLIALEEGELDRLPTGIYLDGIVAAYAREVGADGDALVRCLRGEIAPPLPEPLEEIVAVRPASSTGSPWELSLGLAHGMFAFAGVVVVLAVAGVGVHLYSLQSPAEPQRTVAVRREGVAPPVAHRAQTPYVLPAEPESNDVEPVDTRPQPAPMADSRLADEPSAPPPSRRAVSIEEHAPEVPAPATTERLPLVTGSTLEGTWALATRIESSSLRMFEGLRLEYRVELRHSGHRVEGIGRKISENGVALTGRRQTPIAVQGTIDGGRLTLTFGETGARRSSRGTFDLVVEEAGVLRGSFASDAAHSAGLVEAHRL